MGKNSAKQRIRRLLRLLGTLQSADHPITSATLVAVKHLLQNINKCSLVEVEFQPEEDGIFRFDCCFLPQFIKSQLEAQRLTGTRSSGVDIAPLLTFVLAALARPSSAEESFPTVFRWYSTPCHRYFYLFAYIRDEMEHRVYNVDELMALRRGQVSTGVPILAANPELGKFYFISPHDFFLVEDMRGTSKRPPPYL
jgi:hypothetical protein